MVKELQRGPKRANPSNPVRGREIELPEEIEEIDIPEPSRTDIKETIKHLKNGKAPGIEQAELLKADIDYATTKVNEIMGAV